MVYLFVYFNVWRTSKDPKLSTFHWIRCPKSEPNSDSHKVQLILHSVPRTFCNFVPSIGCRMVLVLVWIWCFTAFTQRAYVTRWWCHLHLLQGPSYTYRMKGQVTKWWADVTDRFLGGALHAISNDRCSLTAGLIPFLHFPSCRIDFWKPHQNKKETVASTNWSCINFMQGTSLIEVGESELVNGSISSPSSFLKSFQ